MGKVLFSYSQSQDAWRTPDPGIIPNTFWCWPAADYEALEAKLAALVEESKITLYYLYNSFEPDNQSKQYDRFKAAIAAADAAKEG